MSLIIATGTNLGDKLENLARAKEALSEKYKLVAESSVYSSPPVGYEDQPGFYNQVLEFEIPPVAAESVMETLLEIELSMGRERDIKWGPRLIDLDIVFWGLEQIQSEKLTVPHPRWSQRAFVVLPLRELPFFQVLEKSFKIPDKFDHQAVIVSPTRPPGSGQK